MTIPFQHIPSNIRVPLFYAEVSNQYANTAQETQRALIIGQITSAGSAVPNVPIISQGTNDAQLAGGPSSMLAAMVAAYRANDSFGEVWYLPIADDPSAVAATGTAVFTAPASGNGTVYFYVAGVLYQLPVIAGQTAVQMAANLAALVSADPTCPVTAVASTQTVTFTAVNKGPVGNNIDLRINYLGAVGGQALPPGVALSIYQMASGSVTPSLTAALANLGSQTFDFIVCPYIDGTSLNALQTLLNDSTGRWSYAQQLYGHVFAAVQGSVGTLVTFGDGRNNQHETVIGFLGSPTPSYEWAAAMCAAAAVSLRDDPALPLQTLPLLGVLAPPLVNRFVLTDCNTLLYNGISTFNVAADGTVSIQNLITTYQKNPFGAADNSYLQVETMYTLMFVLRYMSSAITSKFARMKLADDGTTFAQGSAIVTPNIIRAELIAEYYLLEDNGLVQDAAEFAAGLIVQRNASNPNRVDVLWPGILIDQLRIFAVLAQFRLVG